MKKAVFLLFGPQGSGKSTQGRWLAGKLGLPFFDTGEQLRQLAAVGTPIGQRIKHQMTAGQLVDDEVVITVIRHFLASHRVTSGMVMDGFPRTLKECQLLEQLAQEHNWSLVGIYVQLTEQTIFDRLNKRAATENRADDEPAIITKRLATFQAETLPVIDYLQAHHQLIRVDGEPDIDQVSREIYTALN